MKNWEFTKIEDNKIRIDKWLTDVWVWLKEDIFTALSSNILTKVRKDMN